MRVSEKGHALGGGKKKGLEGRRKLPIGGKERVFDSKEIGTDRVGRAERKGLFSILYRLEKSNRIGGGKHESLCTKGKRGHGMEKRKGSHATERTANWEKKGSGENFPLGKGWGGRLGSEKNGLPRKDEHKEGKEVLKRFDG